MTVIAFKFICNFISICYVVYKFLYYLFINGALFQRHTFYLMVRMFVNDSFELDFEAF